MSTNIFLCVKKLQKDKMTETSNILKRKEIVGIIIVNFRG